MNYYVIAIGKKPGIYITWNECSKYVKGYKNAKYKKFFNLEDAEKFYKKYHNGNLPKKLNYRDNEYIEMAAIINDKKKTCLICGKPFKPQLAKGSTGKRKGTLWCYTCRKRKIKGWSLSDTLRIKEITQCEDPFEYIISNPSIAEEIRAEERQKQEYLKELKAGMTEAERKRNKKEAHEEQRKQQRIAEKKASKELQIKEKEKLRCAMKVSKQQYSENDAIPLFIKNEFTADKEVVKVFGVKQNPRITYHCKRCNEDFTVFWNEYLKKKGHDCSALISSGEAIVADYLKSKNIRFLTQRDTLKCVNPDTGYAMPYDFQIVGKNILIEVQGEQHRKFIERFHVDQEGFEYQKKKDSYKKEFAIKQGYRLIEIWYEDFETGKYMDIINYALA